MVANQAHNLRLRAALKHRQAPRASNQKIITVASGKGGVGKSSLSVLIAGALQSRGKKVLLIDADVGLANVHILLGISTSKTLNDVLQGSADISQAVQTVRGGFDILPGATGLADMVKVGEHALIQFVQNSADVFNRYDYILVDTAAGVAENTMQFCLRSDATLCVCTPDPTSLLDVYSFIKVYKRLRMSIPYVVVNMAKDAREAQNAFSTVHQMCSKFLNDTPVLLGVVQQEKALYTAIRKGIALDGSASLAPVAKKVQFIAQAIISKIPSVGRKSALEKLVQSQVATHG